MSSPHSRHDHLDERSGREVVYCHRCKQEWDHVDHGLICPFCDSEATEIISPENDPREFGHHCSASTSPEMPPSRLERHPVPDEESIDDLMSSPDYRMHHNPSFESVLEHFIDFVHQTQAPRRGMQEDPNTLRNFDPFGQEQAHGHPHVHRTTFTSTLGGGTASATIVSGPSISTQTMMVDPSEAYSAPLGTDAAPPRRRIAVVSSTLADTPSRLFNNIMRDLGLPPEYGRGGPSSRIMDDGFLLMMIFLVSAYPMSGDAVFTQEALDRIITNLREANPRSNAAPPASDEALSKLDRRQMDESMMNAEGKTECTICIDDMEIGQLAATLPCKHRFHDKCVVLWLKEHNTCPVCRAPIEKSPAPVDESRNAESSGEARSPGSHPASGSNSSFAPRRSVWPPIRLTRESEAGPFWNDEQSNFEQSAWLPHPSSQSQSGSNEVISRLLSEEMHRGRSRTRRGADRDWNDLYEPGFPSVARRTSHSPTSPRADYSSRPRHRSPSSSSRRGGGSDRPQRQTSGHGPLSWLQDRFSGNGGSGNNSSRDRSRS
ncbi:hypothetical protein S40288_09588 [Stachybotrys chartarum IBT 40288]|nr:hypothetical protein S40288_09588 [Stachybotrys chartarum IBT 40288]